MRIVDACVVDLCDVTDPYHLVYEFPFYTAYLCYNGGDEAVYTMLLGEGIQKNDARVSRLPKIQREEYEEATQKQISYYIDMYNNGKITKEAMSQAIADAL